MQDVIMNICEGAQREGGGRGGGAHLLLAQLHLTLLDDVLFVQQLLLLTLKVLFALRRKTSR